MHVSRTIYNGIKAIQAGHEVDLSDSRLAATLCRLSGYHEAAAWIANNPDQYQQGLTQGFHAADHDLSGTVSPGDLQPTVNLWSTISNQLK